MRTNNLVVAVRGAGHNVAGLAVCDGGLMIDLSPMKGIHVNAEARTVRVEPGCTWGEVFWGIRGGGGNLGIVTSFKFRVHAAGTVLAGLVLHPLSRGEAALRFWRDYEATAPEELTNGAVFFSAPPDLPVPEVLRAEPIVGLGGVYAGALDAGEEVLRSLRQFGPPAADIFQPMPYSAAQTIADFLFPSGYQNYWKSSYLKELSDGAMSRVPAGGTAFGHRNWPYNFLIISAWENPAGNETNIRWTRDYYAAMEPYLADAVYLNYLGDEGEQWVRAAYGANYERLVTLKDKYGPTNLFRMNQNIRPSCDAHLALGA